MRVIRETCPALSSGTSEIMRTVIARDLTGLRA
jgi:hypothetical protein